MNFYLLLRFLHILSAVLLLGGVIARQLARSFASKATDPQRVATAFQAADPIEKYMVIPGSMLVVIFGVILSLVAGAPLFGFLQGSSQNWLLVSIVLMVLTMLLVPTVFLKRGKVFSRTLEDALNQGVITPELKASLDDPVVAAAHWFEIIAILIVVFLMVFKPF